MLEPNPAYLNVIIRHLLKIQVETGTFFAFKGGLSLMCYMEIWDEIIWRASAYEQRCPASS